MVTYEGRVTFKVWFRKVFKIMHTDGAITEVNIRLTLGCADQSQNGLEASVGKVDLILTIARFVRCALLAV